VRLSSRALKARSWRVPSLYAAAALVLAIVLPRLETQFLPSLTSTVSETAALAMYSSIASGMIALTGIVFSLTFVMVQFSATAYSPRLVLWIARDPIVAHALGVFIATFLYAVAAVAWVGRSAAGVPMISAWIVVGLLLMSVAMFVALIERVAMLQINRMLAFTGDRGRAVIDTLYPPLGSLAAGSAGPVKVEGSPTHTVMYQGRPLTVQAIDIARLVTLAERTRAVIEVGAAVGDTLAASMPLMVVRGYRVPISERLLRAAIELGDERTFEQDPKYALRLLVDIAIKALSPAINDPTTAVQALDQIGDLLLRLSRRQLDIGVFRDAGGAVRVVIPFPSWDDFLRLAFDEIRSYGADSVQVMRRMNALMIDLADAVPVGRRDALREWQARLQRSIERHFDDPADQLDASLPDRQGLGVPRRRPAA
jgi:uncharacterized membrane protein